MVPSGENQAGGMAREWREQKPRGGGGGEGVTNSMHELGSWSMLLSGEMTLKNSVVSTIQSSLILALLLSRDVFD